MKLVILLLFCLFISAQCFSFKTGWFVLRGQEQYSILEDLFASSNTNVTATLVPKIGDPEYNSTNVWVSVMNEDAFIRCDEFPSEDNCVNQVADCGKKWDDTPFTFNATKCLSGEGTMVVVVFNNDTKYDVALCQLTVKGPWDADDLLAFVIILLVIIFGSVVLCTWCVATGGYVFYRRRERKRDQEAPPVHMAKPGGIVTLHGVHIKDVRYHPLARTPTEDEINDVSFKFQWINEAFSVFWEEIGLVGLVFVGLLMGLLYIVIFSLEAIMIGVFSNIDVDGDPHIFLISLVFFGFMFLAIIPISTLMYCGPIYLAIKALKREKVKLKTGFAPLFKHFWRTMLAGVLVGFLVLVGTIFFIIPGIYLSFATRMTFVMIYERPDLGVVQCVWLSIKAFNKNPVAMLAVFLCGYVMSQVGGALWLVGIIAAYLIKAALMVNSYAKMFGIQVPPNFVAPSEASLNAYPSPQGPPQAATYLAATQPYPAPTQPAAYPTAGRPGLTQERVALLEEQSVSYPSA